MAQDARQSPLGEALGDATATARAFAGATRKVSLTLVNQRIAANYLDTRAVIAEYDAGADRLTLTLGSQGSHAVRDVLCAAVLKIAPEKMRVVTPDVGGGFGTKLFPYREYALAAVAARQFKRPVKWFADRSEHFWPTRKGATTSPAQLALDDGGAFSPRVDIIADMGVAFSCYRAVHSLYRAGMSPGVYDIAACHVRVRGAFTNTVPVDAYRGAGRPEASYVIERLIDAAAREIGVAPDVLRRKNFIKPRAMPYTSATGKAYDSGDFAAHLKRAQEIGEWAASRAACGLEKSGRIRRHRHRDLCRGLRQQWPDTHMCGSTPTAV